MSYTQVVDSKIIPVYTYGIETDLEQLHIKTLVTKEVIEGYVGHFNEMMTESIRNPESLQAKDYISPTFYNNYSIENLILLRSVREIWEAVDKQIIGRKNKYQYFGSETIIEVYILYIREKTDNGDYSFELYTNSRELEHSG